MKRHSEEEQGVVNRGEYAGGSGGVAGNERVAGGREDGAGGREDGGAAQVGVAPEHGGRRREAARRLGIPKEELLDFSASINPLGPPEAAVGAVRRTLAEIPYYPEERAGSLMELIAGFLGIAPEEAVPGNGSIELIYWLAAVLRPRSVLIVEPTFSEYRRACEAAGARCQSYAMRPEDGFQLDVMRLDPRGHDMVFVCNPNNPTGQLILAEDLSYLWQKCRSAGAALVVDEAFIDFVGPGASLLFRGAAGCAAGDGGVPAGLFVIRSFTKSFALAGLRVGALAAAVDSARRLRDSMPPWRINVLGQAAAAAALAEGDYLARTRRETARLRARLQADLAAIDGVEPLPSAANFILCRVAGRNAGAVTAGLERQGILVRDCRSFAGLEDGYIRVAVRAGHENHQLITALNKIMAAGDGR